MTYNLKDSESRATQHVKSFFDNYKRRLGAERKLEELLQYQKDQGITARDEEWVELMKKARNLKREIHTYRGNERIQLYQLKWTLKYDTQIT